VFASPYDRTIDTASRLIGSRSGLLVKAEPGLAEGSWVFPPDFEEVVALKERYPLVDPEYQPYYTREAISKRRADSYEVRVAKIVDHIEKNYPNAETVALVSHEPVISSVAHMFVSIWHPAHLASVSKYVRQDEHEWEWESEFINSTSHISCDDK